MIRGYSQAELTARRETVVRLFRGDKTQKAESLRRILEMNRPVAILLVPGDEALLSWLRDVRMGSPVFEADGLTLWLISPPVQQRH
jgi:hypothetical protein